jgi:thiol-disulfide isomerase/thioredoxin
VLVDFLFENYYDKLPLEIQNHQWKNELQQEMNTAVGRVAPDFELSFNNKPSKLLKLSGYKYYIVVFWSTSCSHCLKEVPMFYDYIKDRQDTQVIAVGMETAESKPLWEKEVSDYARFINVFGIGKWENPIAKSYNVHATPEYFILDEHKKIISKPYDFEAVEAFFNNIK